MQNGKYNCNMGNENFKPSKAMGQNFLNDTNISKKIVRLSGIDKTCGVLEIGPGFGALTEILAKTAGHVTAVELDVRLIEKLRESFNAHENVTIIQGDILKTDIRKLVTETLPAPTRHVCANLPYNITTPAITRLIECEMFHSITVMMQREVARRICAASGSSEYGAFTVFVNYHAQSEILFDIPPECFNPRPKVTSSVVRMIIRKERRLEENDERRFFRTVRAAFGQRRKTLVNALYAAYKNTHSKEGIEKAVESCGFDTKIRGERLSIEDFIRLSAVL